MNYRFLTILFFLLLIFLFNIPKKSQRNLENLVENQEIYIEKIKIDEELEKKAAKIDAYFKKHSMPLEGYGLKFVLEAERNGLPHYLLAAIAVQESTGGKFCKNNNPLGWGSAEIKFKDFNEAIEVVSEKLAHHDYYKNKTLEEKLWTYNPYIEYREKIFRIMTKLNHA